MFSYIRIFYNRKLSASELGTLRELLDSSFCEYYLGSNFIEFPRRLFSSLLTPFDIISFIERNLRFELSFNKEIYFRKNVSDFSYYAAAESEEFYSKFGCWPWETELDLSGFLIDVFKN